MNLSCQLVEKTSKKGTKYLALEIMITKDYKKVVFLDSAEIELIKLANANKN